MRILQLRRTFQGRKQEVLSRMKKEAFWTYIWWLGICATTLLGTSFTMIVWRQYHLFDLIVVRYVEVNIRKDNGIEHPMWLIADPNSYIHWIQLWAVNQLFVKLGEFYADYYKKILSKRRPHVYEWSYSAWWNRPHIMDDLVQCKVFYYIPTGCVCGGGKLPTLDTLSVFSRGVKYTVWCLTAASSINRVAWLLIRFHLKLFLNIRAVLKIWFLCTWCRSIDVNSIQKWWCKCHRIFFYKQLTAFC